MYPAPGGSCGYHLSQWREVLINLQVAHETTARLKYKLNYKIRNEISYGPKPESNDSSSCFGQDIVFWVTHHTEGKCHPTFQLSPSLERPRPRCSWTSALCESGPAGERGTLSGCMVSSLPSSHHVTCLRTQKLETISSMPNAREILLWGHKFQNKDSNKTLVRF